MYARIRNLLGATALLLAASLGSAVAPERAQADSAEVDVSIFYASLAPHGDWVHIAPYGWAFVPDDVDYGWRPYSLGRWEWVETYGWTWMSDEPFGWATYHYGRWTHVDDYGWAWVPGTTWGPAWVAFRYGDPWVGWAALPPGPNWRYDAQYDVAGLNHDANIGNFAWNFVSTRYFAEPDLRSRYYVSAYNPYFLQQTRWSTRYASVEGGFANHSLDIAVVEKARGTAVVRRRLRESAAPVVGPGPRATKDEVVVYRPRIARKAPAHAPSPRARADGKPGVDVDAWAARRAAALKAHLEAQKKALEKDPVEADPVVPDRRKPDVSPDEAAKRRKAAADALEEEQKRLQAALERQRKRREQDAKERSKPAPEQEPKRERPGMEDRQPKEDDGQDKKDDKADRKDEDKDDEKDKKDKEDEEDEDKPGMK